ncbi:sialate O-acetylesterase [Prosthecobacter fusiformis]|nr:sialate O-acetylesterase [Prosthecobacter fusiformis]
MMCRFLLAAVLSVSSVSAVSAQAPAFPQANVLLNPGKGYDDVSRVWQGIPGIERAPKGRLWVTWYSGDEGEGAIGNYALVATSGDDGKHWSKPVVAIEGNKGTKIGDPIPWVDPKGRLWVFYNQLTAKTETSPTIRGTCAIRCDDPDSAKPTWSEPFLVAEDGILFGKPIVRAGGGWLAPFFLMGNQAGRPETCTLLSSNEGETWEWHGGTSIPEDLRNFSEATLAQRKDGSIWTVIRTTKGLYESTSTDGGKTWSDAIAMPAYEGPSTRACMMKLASGAFMLIYHDAKKNENGAYPRTRLMAWLSDDEGRTWPHKVMVDERSSVSYPDAIQAPDGRIYITYDHGRYNAGEKEVLVAIISEADIRAGKITSAGSAQRLLVSRALGYGNHSDIRTENDLATKLPPKEKLDLYLLIGQSNMAGRGLLDTEKSVSKLRVLKFSPNNKWTYGVEPLHYDKPAAVGAGLGMSFAREMADANRGVTVGVIPCAVGGTPLERWVKGGDLYAQALERARLAMKDGTLKGILWHQGEGDSGDEGKSKSYADRLAKMIVDLRADLGAGEVPFVAGKLGEFLAMETKTQTPCYWPLVNEQIASIPSRVAKTAVVESTGLKDKGDKVHFDTPSLRTFGVRYAEAMKLLQK